MPMLMLAYLSTGVSCALVAVGTWIFVDTRASRGELAARSMTVRGDLAHPRLSSRLCRALAGRFERSRLGAMLETEISTAGFAWRPFEVSCVAAGAMVGTFVVARAVFGYAMGATAALTVLWAGRMWLRSRRAKRSEVFIAQLPELAALLSSASRAGLSLRAAIEHAEAELEDPAAAELARTAELLRLGQSIEDALEDLSARLRSRELAVLVSTLLIQHGVGGRLASSLAEMASVLEDRKELRRELSTVT